MTKATTDPLIKLNMHRFRYDSQTGQLLWLHPFNRRRPAGTPVGFMDDKGYLRMFLKGNHDIRSRVVLVHRIIWMINHGSCPPQVDHINRIRTDNRLENLRAATNTTNQHNISLRKNNTHGSPGLALLKGRWFAQIRVNRKRFRFGPFTEKSDAVAAYERAKALYHTFDVTKFT